MKLIYHDGHTRDPFCGSRATVTGLEFPRKNRADIARCNPEY